MQEHAATFKKLNSEVIIVYREEGDGVEGLKKIKEKHPTDFTLAVDLNKKSSKAYSPGKMTFDNYVIDSKGVVRKIIDGTLRDRAKANQLIKILREIESESASR